MRSFLIKFFLTCLPILLLFILLESIVRFIPNAFNQKAEFLQDNKAAIKMMILGSSHSQNIIPEKFDCMTVNLAYRGQDIPLDSALFFRYVEELPSLRTVIFELDYISLEKVVSDSYFRLPWYHIYHDIDMGSSNLINRNSLYLSAPVFFNNYVKYIITQSEKQQPVTSTGYTLENYYGDFKALGYDSSRIVSTAAKRNINTHSILSMENYRNNTRKINSIISYCQNHAIHIYFVTMPVFSTYLAQQNPIKKERMSLYIDSLKNTNAITGYWDLEKTGGFKAKDFLDDDHLNSTGMVKLSDTLNAKLYCGQ